MSGTATPAAAAAGKCCRKCRGLCPSGTLESGLCLDCEAAAGPEAETKQSFALALAARSPFWLSVVLNNERARA